MHVLKHLLAGAYGQRSMARNAWADADMDRCIGRGAWAEVQGATGTFASEWMAQQEMLVLEWVVFGPVGGIEQVSRGWPRVFLSVWVLWGQIIHGALGWVSS